MRQPTTIRRGVRSTTAVHRYHIVDVLDPEVARTPTSGSRIDALLAHHLARSHTEQPG